MLAHLAQYAGCSFGIVAAITFFALAIIPPFLE